MAAATVSGRVKSANTARTPNRSSPCENSVKAVPYTIWSTTISSPARSSENRVAEMAAMPDAVTTPASAPSSEASRSSSSAWVGLRVRPYT